MNMLLSQSLLSGWWLSFPAMSEEVPRTGGAGGFPGEGEQQVPAAHSGLAPPWRPEHGTKGLWPNMGEMASPRLRTSSASQHSQIQASCGADARSGWLLLFSVALPRVIPVKKDSSWLLGLKFITRVQQPLSAELPHACCISGKCHGLGCQASCTLFLLSESTLVRELLGPKFN